MSRLSYSIPRPLQYWLDVAPHAIVPTYGVRLDPPDGVSSCRCYRCKPGDSSAGKHPKMRWIQNEDGYDRNVLGTFIKAYLEDPTSVGWSLATGRVGLAVLDVDPRNGGLDTLRGLLSDHGPLPATVQDVTGGGGLHFYFAWRQHTTGRSAIDLGPGVELLSGNHLIQIPPSVHYTGRDYYHPVGRAPYEIPFADPPAWIAAELTPKQKTSAEINQARYSQILRMRSNDERLDRARAYLARIPAAIAGQGGWAHTSSTVVNIVKGFALTETEAFELLSAWNAVCQPPWKPTELRNKIRWALGQSSIEEGFRLTQERRSSSRAGRGLDGDAGTPAKRLRFKIRGGRVAADLDEASTTAATPPQAASQAKAETVKADAEAETEDAGVLAGMDPDERAQYLRAHADDDIGPAYALGTPEERASKRAVLDNMKRERLEAARLVAREVAKIREIVYECLRPRTVIHRSLIPASQFLPDRSVLFATNPRCYLWNCPACAAMHRAEYCDSFYSHLCRGDHGDRPMWTFAVDPDDKKLIGRIMRAINRAGASFYWWNSDRGREFFTTVEISVAGVDGVRQITQQLAYERLCQLTWAHQGDKKPSWNHSQNWKLIKPAKSKLPKTLIGVVDTDLDDLDERVEPEGVKVESAGVPAGWERHIRRRRVVDVTGLSEQKIGRIIDRITDVQIQKVRFRLRDRYVGETDRERFDESPGGLSESFESSYSVTSESDSARGEAWPPF